MAHRSKRFCRCPGCSQLTSDPSGYCEDHRHLFDEQTRRRDLRRGTAKARGYDSRWARYSKAFLAQPGHQLCALRIDEGCAIVAQCVDHIDPPDGPRDPRFWDPANHQPACIHCNSVKGHRLIVGPHRFG
ncbi:MAG: HNH endonuclease [Clostridia bacterium]|nr:HNH endonuclease [Clostridia bacterium]